MLYDQNEKFHNISYDDSFYKPYPVRRTCNFVDFEIDN